MIINLWSTPRTGSVWYSYKLYLEYLNSNKNTILLTEPFNRWHLNIYRSIENGVIKNFHEFTDGLYYDDYALDSDGNVVVNRKFAQRSRTVEEELSHRQWLVENYNAEACTLILHNHTSPLPEGIYEKLKTSALRNIFIYRGNFVEQLSSYAVAIATKRFAKFRDFDEPVFENLEVPEQSLAELTNRILHWETLDKTNCEIVRYEDIEFALNNPDNIPTPRKQNITDSFLKLSTQTQRIILDLKDRYDQCRNLNECKV